MTRGTVVFLRSLALAAACVVEGGLATDADAQALSPTVQITPFAGYRFGSDPYYDDREVDHASPDVGDGPSYGGMLDVFFQPGRAVTFVYSHNDERIDLAATGQPPDPVRVSFDHWLVGGTDEIGAGKARPFLTGLLGVTTIYGGGDTEGRFTVGGGGGVKLLPSRHLGLRLDGRVYAIFLGGGASGGICGPRGCLVGLDVSVMWQAEFTAGVMFSF